MVPKKFRKEKKKKRKRLYYPLSKSHNTPVPHEPVTPLFPPPTRDGRVSSGRLRVMRRAGPDPAAPGAAGCGDAAGGDWRGAASAAGTRRAGTGAGRPQWQGAAPVAGDPSRQPVMGAAWLRAILESGAATRRRWNNLGKFLQLHPFCSRQIRLFD